MTKHYKTWLFFLPLLLISGLLLRPDTQAQAKADSKPATALPALKSQEKTDTALDEYFKTNNTRRAYLMLDKPLYQPGETVWFRVDVRQTQSLAPYEAKAGADVELRSPKGAKLFTKKLKLEGGVGENDFSLPSSAEGGAYTLALSLEDGSKTERTVLVSTYEAPRLKKSLQFVRKAYGPGAEVSAAVTLARQTGEPLSKKEFNAVVVLDDVEVYRGKVTTDGDGAALVKFALPKSIARGDALLTLLVDDGGVTESIQRRVPILQSALSLSLYPEGGDLVEGLESRVYFSAQDQWGEPADIEGRVIDEAGKEVTQLQSFYDGMGSFVLTPSAGKKYSVTIERPAGVTKTYSLPMAKKQGCVLRASAEVELLVACTAAQSLFIEAVSREARVGGVSFKVSANTVASISLPTKKEAQGVVRLTLFDEKQNPLAERLTYRGKHAAMQLEITADKTRYTPRDKVTLHLKATDAEGAPTEANVGLSVVDDTVLSFADDKTANLTAQVLLVPELDGPPIKAPNFYFSKDPKADEALDLLLGTKGYRRFDWQPVLQGKPAVKTMATTTKEQREPIVREGAKKPANGVDADADGIPDADDRCPNEAEDADGFKDDDGCPDGDHDHDRVLLERAEIQILDKVYFDTNSAVLKPVSFALLDEISKVLNEYPMITKVQLEGHASLGEKKAQELSKKRAEAVLKYLTTTGKVDAARLETAAAGDTKPIALNNTADGRARNRRVEFVILEADGMWGTWPRYAPVRVFSGPKYEPGDSGPRSDFRETIFWQAQVKTDKRGEASVSFYLSDATTSFRAISEGFSSSGLVGRGEALIASRLPMSLDVLLPQEVSAGDKLSLPVSLSNETDAPLQVTLSSSFGAGLKLSEAPFKGALSLKAKEKRTVLYPLEVTSKSGEVEINLKAEASGLSDQITKKLKVVPLGFPFSSSFSGSLKESVKHELELTGATEGSVVGKITLYPSPLASLDAGVDGLLREPSGCFEQASSSNYPNVMTMRYLDERGVANPDLIKKTNGLLSRGYDKLAGYESKTKGYEWFGASPGHEALTAYGLMQFVDMKGLSDKVDDKMLARTAAWLLSRRDGNGGFSQSSQALDSFGRASKETADAYIVWALTEAGYQAELKTELESQRKSGLDTKDPYLAALVANSLLNSKSADAQAILKRLVAMQATDGSFPGAKESITMSGGESLVVETTALSIIAMLKASDQYAAQARTATEWLNQHRSGYGAWGNTQSTILSLKALTAYSNFSRQTTAAGEVKLLINGEEVSKQSYEKGRQGAIVFSGFEGKLKAGKNVLELRLKSEAALPYSIVIEHRSNTPPSSEKSAVQLSTTLASSEVKLGEGVKLSVRLENKTKAGLPMVVARVGLPGGLVFQSWQLKELVDRGVVDLYETREREVILYWRQMLPGEVKKLELALLARVPGSYTGAASSAYLYYTAEDKSWAKPAVVSISK